MLNPNIFDKNDWMQFRDAYGSHGYISMDGQHVFVVFLHADMQRYNDGAGWTWKVYDSANCPDIESIAQNRNPLYASENWFDNETTAADELASWYQQQERKLNMQEFRKGDYTIQARNAFPGEYVYNELEGSEYTTSPEKPIVLCGTVGEMWTVSFDKLASTYTYADGAAINIADTLGWRLVQSEDEWWEVRPIQDPSAPTIFAYQTNPGEQVQVQTSWGEVLTANRPGIPHGNGDWIVFANDGYGNPNMNDSWIVNGAVFETTYVPA